jgi:drug/metabolite transporter (DMT)-like permease
MAGRKTMSTVSNPSNPPDGAADIATPAFRPLFQVHTAVLLFGLSGLFGKFLSLSSTVIVFGRTLFAALAILAAARFLNRRVVTRSADGLLVLAVPGVILGLHWVTFFHAIKVSTVAVGLLSFSTFPLFTTVIEPLFFKERLRSIDMATAFLVVAGLTLLIPSFDVTHAATRGVMWGTLSGFLFAVLQVLNRKYLEQRDALQIAFFQNGYAAVMLLPVVIGTAPSVTVADVFLLAILGVLCTGVAHVLFINSLGYLKAHLASVIAGGLEPVYGTLFAFLLLGEKPALRTLIGGAVILSAVAVATLKRRSSDTPNRCREVR